MADPRVVLHLWAIMKLVPLAHATRQHRHLDLQLLADRRTTGLLDPSTFGWPLSLDSSMLRWPTLQDSQCMDGRRRGMG
ncbi:hypothetical protein B0H11DRAFT_2289753 [Mycena galericulata]|nr:hypothetical protein B0H11DRAFT_2289753 [Mycena galericulata]